MKANSLCPNIAQTNYYERPTSDSIAVNRRRKLYRNDHPNGDDFLLHSMLKIKNRLEKLSTKNNHHQQLEWNTINQRSIPVQESADSSIGKDQIRRRKSPSKSSDWWKISLALMLIKQINWRAHEKKSREKENERKHTHSNTSNVSIHQIDKRSTQHRNVQTNASKK